MRLFADVTRLTDQAASAVASTSAQTLDYNPSPEQLDFLASLSNVNTFFPARPAEPSNLYNQPGVAFEEPARQKRSRSDEPTSDDEGSADRHACHFDGCSTSFTRKVDLQRHIMFHTGERPYKCTWIGCTKGFVQVGLFFAVVERTILMICELAGVCVDCTYTYAYW